MEKGTRAEICYHCGSPDELDGAYALEREVSADGRDAGEYAYFYCGDCWVALHQARSQV